MKKKSVPAHCKLIKKRLIDKDMTQRELAKKVGMSENYLTGVLQGRKAGTMYLDKIFKILDIEGLKIKAS